MATGDRYVRILINQAMAFPLALLAALGLTVAVSVRTLQFGGILVAITYAGFFLMPFWLLDGLFVRPAFGDRQASPILFVIEFAGAGANLGLIRGASQIRSIAIETAVFVTCYFAISLVLFRVRVRVRGDRRFQADR